MLFDPYSIYWNFPGGLYLPMPRDLRRTRSLTTVGKSGVWGGSTQMGRAFQGTQEFSYWQRPILGLPWTGHAKQRSKRWLRKQGYRPAYYRTAAQGPPQDPAALRKLRIDAEEAASRIRLSETIGSEGHCCQEDFEDRQWSGHDQGRAFY